MNTTDFSRYVADKYGTTYKDTKQWVAAITESIGDVLVSGEDLVVTNLGTFRNIISAPKKGRNRYTGEPIDIPERRKIKFVICDNLNQLIREQFELDTGISQETTVRIADISLERDIDTSDETDDE